MWCKAANSLYTYYEAYNDSLMIISTTALENNLIFNATFLLHLTILAFFLK